MCSPGKGDCRIPSGWKVVYPPRSEPSVASRRCWRANRVAKPNVCVYSHNLGNVKCAPSHSPEFAPRRSIRLPLDACHASSGTPGPLRFPNARALSLPGAPPTPNRVRRAVSIGRIRPVHTLVRFSDELWNWLFDPSRTPDCPIGELVCWWQSASSSKKIAWCVFDDRCARGDAGSTQRTARDTPALAP